MDAKLRVELLALKYRRKLWVIFFGIFTGSILLGWFGVWTLHQTGWEAVVLSYTLLLIMCVGLVTSLLFAGMLRGAYKMYSGAIGNAGLYERDPDKFCRVYSDVVGPIPWR